MFPGVLFFAAQKSWRSSEDVLAERVKVTTPCCKYRRISIKGIEEWWPWLDDSGELERTLCERDMLVSCCDLLELGRDAPKLHYKALPLESPVSLKMRDESRELCSHGSVAAPVSFRRRPLRWRSVHGGLYSGFHTGWGRCWIVRLNALLSPEEASCTNTHGVICDPNFYFLQPYTMSPTVMTL